LTFRRKVYLYKVALKYGHCLVIPASLTMHDIVDSTANRLLMIVDNRDRLTPS